MRYIALGDSISIDEYPSLDFCHTEGEPLGAASQFHRLLEKRLRQRVAFTNLTQDGATCANIRSLQLPHASKFADNNTGVVTLTAGGNDVSFGAMRLRSKGLENDDEAFEAMMAGITTDFVKLADEVRETFPTAIVILNTLYDPTDGIGKLPADCGLWADIAPLYSKGRRQLGKAIRAVYEHHPQYKLADIFTAFNGRGMTADPKDRLYYSGFFIEPGYKGAEVIAKLWDTAFSS